MSFFRAVEIQHPFNLINHICPLTAEEHNLNIAMSDHTEHKEIYHSMILPNGLRDGVKIALFGLNGNPPTLKHRRTVNHIATKFNYNEVWVLPSFSQNPLDEKTPFEDIFELSEICFLSLSTENCELRVLATEKFVGDQLNENIVRDSCLLETVEFITRELPRIKWHVFFERQEFEEHRNRHPKKISGICKVAHVHIIDSDGGKSDKDYDATESLTDSGRKPTIHSDQDLKGASSAQVRGWLRSKAVFVEGSKWPPVLVDSALDVNLYPAVKKHIFDHLLYGSYNRRLNRWFVHTAVPILLSLFVAVFVCIPCVAHFI